MVTSVGNTHTATGAKDGTTEKPEVTSPLGIDVPTILATATREPEGTTTVPKVEETPPSTAAQGADGTPPASGVVPPPPADEPVTSGTTEVQQEEALPADEPVASAGVQGEEATSPTGEDQLSLWQRVESSVQAAIESLVTACSESYYGAIHIVLKYLPFFRPQCLYVQIDEARSALDEKTTTLDKLCMLIALYDLERDWSINDVLFQKECSSLYARIVNADPEMTSFPFPNLYPDKSFAEYSIEEQKSFLEELRKSHPSLILAELSKPLPAGKDAIRKRGEDFEVMSSRVEKLKENARYARIKELIAGCLTEAHKALMGQFLQAITSSQQAGSQKQKPDELKTLIAEWVDICSAFPEAKKILVNACIQQVASSQGGRKRRQSLSLSEDSISREKIIATFAKNPFDSLTRCMA